LKTGGLIPNRNKVISFADYAKNFWERNSEYVKQQESRRDITDSYLSNCKKYVNKQLIPYFGISSLDKITEKEVNKWLLGFKERGFKKNGQGYKNTYANTVFGTLNVMLAEAVKRGLITKNPCDNINRLKNDRRKIEILTVDEVRLLFPQRGFLKIWGNKKLAYAANRLASITGMRFGEILGLRGENVHDTYIDVCGQYTDFGYGSTKTKESRFIPVLPEMIATLKELIKDNGKGYIFSLDGGVTPVSRTYITREFNRALVKIGINNIEIKKRSLSMHSWRHFVNTELQRQGLTIQQVQSVTGHKSDGMV
jgi:integrase